jgi:iron complex outermembrane receptor protein
MRNIDVRALQAAAMAATAAAIANPVLAASTLEDSPSPPPAGVDEVVVTAEKRERALQRTAEAISAYTAARRDLIGVSTLQDMANFTPGLQYNYSRDRVSLRGIGRLNNQLSTDASVANYADGVYETFASGANRSTLFLDRVEILRGPQGTLYGRNAIAGAINKVSRRPTSTPYAEMRVGEDNYAHADIEAAVSGPLNGAVEFRVAGRFDRQTKGWVRNIVPGQPDEGGVLGDAWLVEGQLAVRFSRRLDNWTRVDVGGYGRALSSAPAWTRAPFATAEGAFNPGYGCSGNVTGVVNLSPAGCANPAARTPWVEAKNEPHRADLPAYLAIASEWTWRGDGFEARYLTGGVYYHSVLTGSNDQVPITQYTLPGALGAPGLVVHPRSAFRYEEQNGSWSHELNVLSTGDDPLQWQAGAYLFDQHYRQPTYESSPDEPALDSIGGPEVFPGECDETGGVCAPVVGRRHYDDRPDVRSRSAAVFGQVDWAFAPDFRLTAGLRWSHDRKWGVEQARAICYGEPACFFYPEYAGAFGGLPAIDLTQLGVVGTPNDQPRPKGVTSDITWDPVTGLASRSFDASWSAVTGGAGVEWTPDPNTLLYAKYDRGYRSGGYYVGIETLLAANPRSDKETVDAFEVGYKKTFGGVLTMNLAAFHYRYYGLQITADVPNTSGDLGQTQTFFFNVPRSVSQGIELETLWSPSPRLAITFNYGYLDAHVLEGALIDPTDPAAQQPGARPVGSLAQCRNTIYGDPVSTCPADVDSSPRPLVSCPFPAFEAPCFTPLSGVLGGGYQRLQNLRGNRLPNAPRHKIAVNATYTFRFAAGQLSPSVSWVWRSEQYGSLFTRPYNRAPPWDQWDARLTFTSANGRLTLIAWIKNIANTIGYDAGADSTRIGGRYDNPPFGFPYRAAVSRIYVASTYYVNPPRTFGVEAQYRFF